MTQEELDALMANDGELEELESESGEENGSGGDSAASASEDEQDDEEYKTYKLSPTGKWPPPPPTDDHKVVNQLDDVTRDSEAKMTQVFDRLEAVSNCFMDIEGDINAIKETINSQSELIAKLHGKFPNISAFGEASESLESSKEKVENILGKTLEGGDEVMMAMDIMQYQDIHRQKIERVINVMRALSKYMNSLFEGKMEDDKRVSSAAHIVGDATDDVVSEDDIEDLINSLGKK